VAYLEPVEYANPWRRAAIVAALVAVAELVGLVLLAFVIVGKPLARSLHHAAVVTAENAPAKHTQAAAPRPVVEKPRLSRARTGVLVLNGNGHQGAAANAAQRLQVLGYRIGAAGNAPRSDYAASMVMFRPGYRPEAVRLARDLGVRIVTPLDGLSISQLRSAQVALILGK
jgi:LytR cell envelope-related transcriptional attenuator